MADDGKKIVRLIQHKGKVLGGPVLQKAVLLGAEDDQEKEEEDQEQENQEEEAEEEADEPPPPPAKAPIRVWTGPCALACH